MVEDLNAAPEGSVIMLQASGHNPTGLITNNLNKQDKKLKYNQPLKKKKHLAYN